jgi:hypothetical protein
VAVNAVGGAGVVQEFALALVAENTEKDEARSTAAKIFINNTVCSATFSARHTLGCAGTLQIPHPSRRGPWNYMYL